MNQPDSSSSSNTPVVWRLDEVCHDFTKEHQAGRRPRIEHFLRKVPKIERRDLLQQLLGIEVELRMRAGDPPTEHEYLGRFPNNTEIVDLVFRDIHDPTAHSDFEIVRVTCSSDACNYLNLVAKHLATPGQTCPRCGQDLFVITPPKSENQAPLEAQSPGPVLGLPTNIGRFEIKERLGAGGFGIVYRAFDPRLDREVAIKVSRSLSPTPTSDVKHFLREAKTAAKLRHPNIVPIHDADTLGEVHYIAYAYIESVTLAETLRHRRFDPQEAARIVRTLAEALDNAHQAGIVHRDIKPQNVLLAADGNPMITDFGLAHLWANEETLTEEGVLVGTPAYMSPEQATGRQATTRSDQYSLGVVLYEMLSGRKPFLEHGHVLIAKIITDEPPTLRQIDPGIPRELEAICAKAMNKREADRYGNCQELADDLARFLSGEAVQARPANWLGHLRRWLHRPQRIRDAGVLAILTAIFFVIHSLTGIANVFLGAPDTLRPWEATSYLAAIACFHAGLGGVGYYLLRGRVWAIVVTIAFASAGLAFTVANIALGFFDVGGLLRNHQEIRVLYLTLFFIAALNLVMSLIALNTAVALRRQSSH